MTLITVSACFQNTRIYIYAPLDTLEDIDTFSCKSFQFMFAAIKDCEGPLKKCVHLTPQSQLLEQFKEEVYNHFKECVRIHFHFAYIYDIRK